MQLSPPSPLVAWDAPPPPPPPPRRRRFPLGARVVVLFVLVATVAGVLLGGRESAEDGRLAATAALAAGDPARAVSLDEAVAGRSGFLMVLDPGASSQAEHDAQVARIAWARMLAGAGDVDSAIAVLRLVGQPALLPEAAETRAQLLLDAAAAAIKGGRAELALLRLNEAAEGPPPSSMAPVIAAMTAADEVQAAVELVAVNRAPDALSLLDDASTHRGAAVAVVYPPALLSAARSELASLDYADAAATLRRLVSSYPGSSEARSARALLRTPQPVLGTLVDGAGHGAAGRVRLSTHFTQLPGGYVTGGPFYYGTSDANGDFTVKGVPVGGPYVLEYFRDGGWMTLIDPRTDQPADPVRVAPVQPEDLSFIVLPA